MRGWRAVAVCAAVFVFSCASKPSPPAVGPTSGVDPGDDANPRHLTDLTESERQQLCDWTAAIGGGYDASFVCESGLEVSSFMNQQACLDAFLGACGSVTVTDWEQCRDKVVSDPCAQYLYTAPECATIARCLGETDGGPAPDPDAGEGGM
jgi:hypothetical protein